MTAPPRLLTVLLITYNHEAFVEQALESVLMQRTDDPFEVLVADDCSTDGTLRIVERFAREHPDVRFAFLDAGRNVGITRNYQRAFSAVRSEYVAVLEGDDYWVDPRKLQTQLDFLDCHREFGLCSVNYYVFEEDACRFTPRVPAAEGHAAIGARDLIADNVVGNFSTCMYRTRVLRQIPAEIFEIRSYDWAINICVAKQCLIGFLRKPMSVYRIHQGGSWSLLSHPEKVRAQLKLIPEYDRATGGVFGAEFAQLADRLSAYLSGLEHAGAPPAPTDPLAQVDHGIAAMTATMPRYRDLMPPLMIQVANALLPPAVKRMLVRWMTR